MITNATLSGTWLRPSPRGRSRRPRLDSLRLRLRLLRTILITERLPTVTQRLGRSGSHRLSSWLGGLTDYSTAWRWGSWPSFLLRLPALLLTELLRFVLLWPVLAWVLVDRLWLEGFRIGCRPLSGLNVVHGAGRWLGLVRPRPVRRRPDRYDAAHALQVISAIGLLESVGITPPPAPVALRQGLFAEEATLPLAQPLPLPGAEQVQVESSH
jgi:hypothetical protein